MKDQPTPDEVASAKLMRTMRAFMGQNEPMLLVGNGYMQSTFAQTGLQAVINLLRHKNIISEGELQQALAHTYNEREEHFHDKSIIAAPPPVVNPRRM